MVSSLITRIEHVERRLSTIETRLGIYDAPRPLEPPPLPAPPVNQPAEPLLITPRMIAPPAPLSPPRKTESLESTIGRHWTSWVGAIVVILGVLFFLQYNWDKIRILFSPAVRTWSVLGLGVILAAVGEVLHRKKLRALAGIVQGIAIAIAMAACFTAHATFSPPVFSLTQAFAGVCLISAAGIALALRTNTLALAIVALLGAYISPLILSTGQDRSLQLILYLGALAAVGWTLSYLKPRWHALRWFTWSATTTWMAIWMTTYGHHARHRALALSAGGYFFAGFIAEAIATLVRAMRIRNPNDESKVPRFTRPLEASLALISILSTALFFAIAWLSLYTLGPVRSGIFAMRPIAAVAVGLAAIHAMFTFATPSTLFSRASWMLAAALVTLAVPLSLGQSAITLAWAILALALAVIARGRPSTAPRVWMIILLALSLARLFTFDWFDAAPTRAALDIAGQPVSPWLIMASALAVLAHVLAWLQSKPATTAHQNIAHILAAAGTCAFLAAAALTWNGPMLTLLMLTWLAGLLATAILSDSLTASANSSKHKEEEKTAPVPVSSPLRVDYTTHAAVVALLLSCKWLALDGLNPIVQHWNDPADLLPLVNLPAIAGAILIASLLWIARKLTDQTRTLAHLAAAILAFAALNFETLRAIDLFAPEQNGDATSFPLADIATAKQVALSVLWAVTGLAAVIIGFAKNLRPLRYAALALLGVTLAKVLLLDMAQVKPLYRILSFLAVGGLLLCVSFVYHRQSQLRVET